MDPEVLAEAKDFVSSGIEKFAGGASGLDTMVSFGFQSNLILASMQIRKRIYGPAVWPSLALCDGRGFLLRGNETGEIYLVYVLCWQVGRATL